MRLLSATSLLFLLFSSASAQDSMQSIDLSPGKKLVLKDVTFAGGSSSIQPASYVILEKLAAYLAARPDMDIEIGGHADNRGNAKRNLALSSARANAVKQFLVQRGIAPARIFTRGYGDTYPIADNNTEEGRSQNRRVEVVGISPRTARMLTMPDNSPILPDGKITAIQRDVRERAPWNLDWRPAFLQQPVYEHHKINTGANSRSTVTFNDQSQLQIGENALVVIYGSAPTEKTNRPAQNVALLSGDLYAKLTSARLQNRLSIRTRAADIAMGNSAGKIGIDSRGRSLVSVHRGEAKVRGMRSAPTFEEAQPLASPAVDVPDDFGTRIAENTPPEAPRRLPPAPKLLAPTSLTESPVQFQWQRTTEQTRFDISNTDTFDSLVFTTVSNAESVTTSLAAGTYFVRLTAIDSIGLESKPFVSSVSVLDRLPRQLPLSLRSPTLESGTLTMREDFILLITTGPRATIFINGDSLTRADESGAAKVMLKLRDRYNSFEVVARDGFNYSARQVFSVEYLPMKRWYGFFGLSVSPVFSSQYPRGIGFRAGAEYHIDKHFSLHAEAQAGRLFGAIPQPDLSWYGGAAGAQAFIHLDWGSPFLEARLGVATVENTGFTFLPSFGAGARFKAEILEFVLFGRYQFITGDSFQERTGARNALDIGVNLAF